MSVFKKTSRLRQSWDQCVGITRLILITLDISLRTVVQHWRGPDKMTRAWSDKTIQSWSGRLLKAAQIDLSVEFLEPIIKDPTRTYIVMCNHTSHFDIPISLLALKGLSVRMMAKKELYKIPLFGKAMSTADFPMIDRQNRRQSIKDLIRAQEIMSSGIVVWVAPEGTRSPDGVLGEFKRGAFQLAIGAKAIIIPIGIQGAHEVLSAKSLKLKRRRPVHVTVGHLIDASEYSSHQKDELLHKVRDAIATLIASPKKNSV